MRVADDLVGELRSRPVPRERLWAAARFVAEHATRREVAKLAAAACEPNAELRQDMLAFLAR